MRPLSPRRSPIALESTRARIPRSLIAIAFVFALLFAGSIETLANHHHDDLDGSRPCAVCQVVLATAAAPPAAVPAPGILPENPCRPDDLFPAAPNSSHLVILRLRAPPTD
jgi:hypothetical protein